MSVRIPDAKYLEAVAGGWTAPEDVSAALGGSKSAARARLGLLFQRGQAERIRNPDQKHGRASYLYRGKSE